MNVWGNDVAQMEPSWDIMDQKVKEEVKKNKRKERKIENKKNKKRKEI